MWRPLLNTLVEKANIYNGIQQLVGSDQVWTGFLTACETVIEQWSHTPDQLWLDLGCGTAEVLERLPKHISYLGVDNNPQYIEFAKQKYQHRANTTFVCTSWNEIDWHDIVDTQAIRVVSLLGLLHHLNDVDARAVLRLSHDLLSREGFMITLDGCHEVHASKRERFFYWIDRGQYIRNSARLAKLFPMPPEVSLHTDWLRVPYCYAVCRVQKT